MTTSRKELYRLTGVIKKTKEADDIYCVADSVEDAIAQCSGFADDVTYVSKASLGKGWNNE